MIYPLADSERDAKLFLLWHLLHTFWVASPINYLLDHRSEDLKTKKIN